MRSASGRRRCDKDGVRSNEKWPAVAVGAAMIETVLVTPVLLWLGMGMVEFGQYFYYKNIFEQAARDAARAAIMPGAVAADPQTAAARVFAAHNVPYTASWLSVVDITPFGGGPLGAVVVTNVGSIPAGHALQVSCQTTYDQIPGTVRPLNTMTGQGIKTGKVILGQTTAVKE